MSDKHILLSMLGGFLCCGIAVLLEATLGTFTRFDSGDDGIGLILLGGVVVAAIVGFIVTARVPRKRFEAENRAKGIFPPCLRGEIGL